MFSRTLVRILSGTILLAAGVAVAQVPSTFHPPLAVLRSPHAEGNLSEAHAIQVLWCAVTELRLSPDSVPRIVLVHAGHDTLDVAAIPISKRLAGVVLVEPMQDNGKVYYLWVDGKDGDATLSQGFVRILRTAWGLSDSDENAVTKRVLARLNSVVRVDDLKRGMFAAPQ